MEIKEIEENLCKAMAEAEEKIKVIEEEYKKIVEKINWNLDTYISKRADLPVTVNYIANTGWTLKCASYVNPARSVANNLKSKVEQSLKDVYSSETSQSYNRRWYANKILSNLRDTFGKLGNEITDEANRLNCINESAKYSLYFRSDYPREVSLREYVEDIFTHKQIDLLKKRAISREDYERIIIERRKLEINANGSIRSKDSQKELDHMIEELRNTAYRTIQDPIDRQYKIQELTEKEWDEKKDEILGKIGQYKLEQ